MATAAVGVGLTGKMGGSSGQGGRDGVVLLRRRASGGVEHSDKMRGSLG